MSEAWARRSRRTRSRGEEAMAEMSPMPARYPLPKRRAASALNYSASAASSSS